MYKNKKMWGTFPTFSARPGWLAARINVGEGG